MKILSPCKPATWSPLVDEAAGSTTEQTDSLEGNTFAKDATNNTVHFLIYGHEWEARLAMNSNTNPKIATETNYLTLILNVQFSAQRSANNH
jgi:hypothetical protein